MKRASGTPLRAHAARLAHNTRRIRHAMGLTSGTVARRMGLRCEANVLMVELGTRPLTVPWLQKLADALDVTPGQLFRGDVRYERLHIDPAPPVEPTPPVEPVEAEPEQAEADVWGHNQPLWPKKAGWP